MWGDPGELLLSWTVMTLPRRLLRAWEPGVSGTRKAPSPALRSTGTVARVLSRTTVSLPRVPEGVKLKGQLQVAPTMIWLTWAAEKNWAVPACPTGPSVILK